MSEQGTKQQQMPDGTQNEIQSELEQPQWSVISFARREADGLTYTQAEQKLAELDSSGVAGLCIVTLDAAGRVRPKSV
jgi:hypothetical protein